MTASPPRYNCTPRRRTSRWGSRRTASAANVARALVAARDAGLLTVALVGGDGGEIGRMPGLDHVLIARSTDPQVVKEVQVTTYHVLWELVHIFFEQPSVLDPAVFLG